jgi:hypothetical protein
MESVMASSSAKNESRAKFAAPVIVWGAGILWVALCLAPYVYAANDLIQWR